jgi:thioester reductase-like protein
MGHSRTGAINDMSDILPLLLKGCILLGKYPAFDIEVTLAPVDYVSQAMVHLASQEKSWGRAFHFFNPAPIAWRRLMAILRALGYSLEEVAYDQWWQELKQRTRQNPAQPAEHKSFFATLLLALIAPHLLLYKRPPLDASYTQEGLAGTDIVCAPFDQALTATYVAYWQKSKYLPMPSEQPTLS